MLPATSDGWQPLFDEAPLLCYAGDVIVVGLQRNLALKKDEREGERGR